MTKVDFLRRFLLPCFSNNTTTTSTTAATTTPKKRLSTSLRDDVQDAQDHQDKSTTTEEEEEESISIDRIPTRPSKSMVIGTIYGRRRGHFWFCIQHDRLNTKPYLLLELPIPTNVLVKEMQSGLVRIALESEQPDMESCPLHSIPIWTMYCNGRKVGFGLRRKATEKDRLMLKTMQSITVGTGVVPAGSSSLGGDGEIMYMRANYDRVLGSPDFEAFHLINTESDESSDQEFSVFLLRSR